MRASMAYFAGAGTVIVAIAAGLGGGLMISDIVSPSGTRTPSKLEQRAATQQALPSPQPPPSTSVTASAPQAPVPYLAATQAATTTAVASAPSNSPQPATASNSAAPPAAPATAKTDMAASTDATKPAQAQTSQPPAQLASRNQTSSPDNAYAKAREAELMQLEEKKRTERLERHQQWMTRRSQLREQDRSQRHDHDVRDVDGPDESVSREVIVRRDDGGREDLFGRPMRSDIDREDFDRPSRFNFPRINLFGPD
jgi:hypothetical protein